MWKAHIYVIHTYIHTYIHAHIHSNIHTYLRSYTCRYMADLHFLDKQIWPEIKNSQIAHDSYCCDRFPNARPYPTQRDMLVLHMLVSFYTVMYVCMYVCIGKLSIVSVSITFICIDHLKLLLNVLSMFLYACMYLC